MPPDRHDRTDIIKLYELILESEDRYLNRAETRSRFYQVTVSALLGSGMVILLQVIANAKQYGPIEILVAGFAIQAVGGLASFVAIWALPAIYRVYRRSVWEGVKRYKMEMLLGLSEGLLSVPPWPPGLEELNDGDPYLAGRQNLAKGQKPTEWLNDAYIERRTTRGVYRWNSFVFYVLAAIGMIIAGAATVLDIRLAISFGIEATLILGALTWTFVFVGRIK